MKIDEKNRTVKKKLALSIFFSILFVLSPAKKSTAKEILLDELKHRGTTQGNILISVPDYPEINKFQVYQARILMNRELLSYYSLEKGALYVAVPEEVEVDYSGNASAAGVIARVCRSDTMKNYPPQESDFVKMEPENVFINHGINAVLGFVPYTGLIRNIGNMLETLWIKGQSPPAGTVFYSHNTHDNITFTWSKIPFERAIRNVAFSATLPIRFSDQNQKIHIYAWLEVIDNLGVPNQYQLGPYQLSPFLQRERKPALVEDTVKQFFGCIERENWKEVFNIVGRAPGVSYDRQKRIELENKMTEMLKKQWSLTSLSSWKVLKIEPQAGGTYFVSCIVYVRVDQSGREFPFYWDIYLHEEDNRLKIYKFVSRE